MATMQGILGIDEVGRGAWAGPLVIGAVILSDHNIKGLTDSKLLSKPQRENLAAEIHKSSVFAGLGWVTSLEIDQLGLTKSTVLGIKRAITSLKYKEIEIIIDGNINYLKNYKNSRCLIKADQTVPAVSAAGIIAKVARDEYMAKLAVKFPSFGFDSHVGYGTKRHADNLNEYGICAEHRISFKPVSVFA